MFKNLIVFRVEAGWSSTLEQAEEALGAMRFVPCGPSQEKSAGWTAPRGEDHGLLVESIGGQWLLEYMIESKSIPASVVRRQVDERAAQIEATTGRKPGKKERKELKEDVTHALMPLAFTRHARVAVWIDPVERRLVIDTGNAARADEVVSALVKSLDGFGVAMVSTQIEPAAAMSNWLDTQEPPAGFTIDRECELKATDDSKSTVRYAKHALDIDEVRQHIASGKRPTRLAMTWEGRVSFELTDALQVRKVAFLEGVFEGGGAKEKDEGFDADAAIATGELGQLMPALVEALGGEMQLGATPLPTVEKIDKSGATTSTKTKPGTDNGHRPEAETAVEDAPF